MFSFRNSHPSDQIHLPSEQQNFKLNNIHSFDNFCNEPNPIGPENFKACSACSLILGTNMPCLGPPFHDGSWSPPWAMGIMTHDKIWNL